MADLRGYDAWKTSPPEEGRECPGCGGTDLTEDRAERTIDCNECGWGDGFDWDAEAERRMEARLDDDPGRDVW
jgi:hypothetical protein